MKIYTRTGDQGQTGLWGGKRVSKHDLRIQAYGTVDECNSLLGLAQTVCPDELKAPLTSLQNTLFVLGADLASPEDSAAVPRIQASDVTQLENWIDEWETHLPPLTAFILPGGSPTAAWLHLTRTVSRRAERMTVALSEAQPINPQAIIWLNRLSDLLFVMARYANFLAGQADIPWQKPD
ncbi:MAG: cob(I)yrinic acid a,c-diamide adenosyltransferase [Candidatus Sericytochromatia bacterium]